MNLEINDHYFDHDADTGIIGRGENIERCFEDAARVTFGIMANLSQVNPTHLVRIEFIESDLELALVTWLNLLLAHASASHSIYSKFHLTQQGDLWRGEAWGERWHQGIERGVGVKGATLTMLSVRQHDGAWEARCVVDV